MILECRACGAEFEARIIWERFCSRCLKPRPAPNGNFDGETFDPQRDGTRLQIQFERVRSIVLDGQWHTLPELHEATGFPEASISARLRDLRKKKFGGYEVERDYVGDGLWRYRVSR